MSAPDAAQLAAAVRFGQIVDDYAFIANTDVAHSAGGGEQVIACVFVFDREGF